MDGVSDQRTVVDHLRHLVYDLERAVWRMEAQCSASSPVEWQMDWGRGLVDGYIQVS